MLHGQTCLKLFSFGESVATCYLCEIETSNHRIIYYLFMGRITLCIKQIILLVYIISLNNSFVPADCRCEYLYSWAGLWMTRFSWTIPKRLSSNTDNEWVHYISGYFCNHNSCARANQINLERKTDSPK